MFIEDYDFKDNHWYMIQRKGGCLAVYHYFDGVLRDSEYRAGYFCTGDIHLGGIEPYRGSRTYLVVCEMVKCEEEGMK